MRHLLFSFSGRIDRLTYIVGLLMALAPLVIMFGIIASLGHLFPGPISSSNKQMVTNVGALIAVVAILLSIWMKLALAIKRLHDMGYSGAFSLLLFVPIVGVAMIFVLLALPGEDNKNRFGRTPEGFWQIGTEFGSTA